MTPTEALETFLKRAVVRRLERHLEFARSVKRRGKFLDTFHHALELDLNPEATVVSIPNDILIRPAFLYAPPATFGAKLSSLQDLLVGFETSCLAVSVDGSAAIFRPEDWIDKQMLFDWT